MTPTIGAIVLYALTRDDADRIRICRESRYARVPAYGYPETGVTLQPTDELPSAGDEVSMLITAVRDLHTGSVNGTIYPEGGDAFWVRGVSNNPGDGDAFPGRWRWKSTMKEQ